MRHNPNPNIDLFNRYLAARYGVLPSIPRYSETVTRRRALMVNYVNRLENELRLRGLA